MKQLFYAWRTFLHSRVSFAIKVISVGVGLGVATLLLVCVAYNHSFNRHFKDCDRVKQLWMTYNINGTVFGPNDRCIGKLAGGIYEEMPDVIECAATMMFDKSKVTAKNVSVDANVVCADSLVFKTLGIDIVKCKDANALAQLDVAFISDELADRLFGNTDPIGQHINIDKIEITVCGVYRALPETSTIRGDIFVSLPSLFSQSGSNYNYSWNGGDSWVEFVRLRKDAKITTEELNKRINDVLHKHAPDRPGCELSVEAADITDAQFIDDPSYKIMDTIMGVLAIVLVVITVMNYILISIASLARRAKSVGVQKCCGAGTCSILGMFMWETVLIVVAAFIVSAVLIWLTHGFLELTLGVSMQQLFAPSRIWIVPAVMVLLLAVGGLVPAYMLSRIPVTHVFRRVIDNRRGWKRCLLFVQFAGVAFICALLIGIAVQYRHVLERDPGYHTQNMVYGYHQSHTLDELNAIQTYYKSLPMVEAAAASAMGNPINGYSGEMMYDDQGQARFSTRYDGFTKEYADLLGFKLLKGRFPQEMGEAAVNSTFVDHMGWTMDNAIGHVVPSEWGDSKIVGVLQDFTICDCFASARKEFIMHYYPYPGVSYVLKLKEPFAENLIKLNEQIATDFPGQRLSFTGMEQSIAEHYSYVKLFRNIALLSFVSILFIAMMGLIGYIGNELQRRTKEIAVRKINGAGLGSILDMFISDTMCVAVPAVVIGTGIAAWIGLGKLADLFDPTAVVDNLWAWFVMSALLLIVIIMVSVVVQVYRIANDNPVNSLRSE